MPQRILGDCSLIQSFWKLRLHSGSMRAHTLKLGICSVHNRNRLSEELESSKAQVVQCTRTTPCILDNAGERTVCTTHGLLRHYGDLMQKGEIMICHQFVRCAQALKMCAKHKRIRPLKKMREKDDTFVCEAPFECDKKIMCDYHKEYRYRWHLVKYKNTHICRHDVRCINLGDSISKVPIEKFVYLDELWGDGEDIVVNKIVESGFQEKRFSHNADHKRSF